MVHGNMKAVALTIKIMIHERKNQLGFIKIKHKTRFSVF